MRDDGHLDHVGILFPEHAHDFVSRDKQYGGISVLEFITAGKNLKTQANIYDKFFLRTLPVK